MVASQADKQRIWEQAFIAAITGLSARPAYEAPKIAQEAVAVANMAVSQYSHALSAKTGF